MSKVVRALLGCKCLDELADQLHQRSHGASSTLAQGRLQLQADRLVGGADAVLVIDDISMPKKGDRSVGVAPQYASTLGKTANCQTLVSLTLARGEVPVMVALRLFLPENWTSDPVRLKRAGVPIEHRTARSKPEIALAEIDRVSQPVFASAVCWRMRDTDRARRSVML